MSVGSVAPYVYVRAIAMPSILSAAQQATMSECVGCVLSVGSVAVFPCLLVRPMTKESTDGTWFTPVFSYTGSLLT